MLYLAVIVFRGSALVLRFRMLCYKTFFLNMKIKIYHAHFSWDFPPTFIISPTCSGPIGPLWRNSAYEWNQQIHCKFPIFINGTIALHVSASFSAHHQERYQPYNGFGAILCSSVTDCCQDHKQSSRCRSYNPKEGIQICESGSVKVVHKFARQQCTRCCVYFWLNFVVSIYAILMQYYVKL